MATKMAANCPLVNILSPDYVQVLSMYCFINLTAKIEYEPRHEISNNVLCATSNGSDQHTHKLLTKHHLEFHSFRRGCTGSSESIYVKMPHCWKSRVETHMYPNIEGRQNGDHLSALP